MNCTPFTFLHPNISMHILLNVLYKFPKVLTRRICLTIKHFFTWWCCGSILSLVQISFSFVSNSLSYITIPKNKKKVKFEPRTKLNHNSDYFLFFLQSWFRGDIREKLEARHLQQVKGLKINVLSFYMKTLFVSHQWKATSVFTALSVTSSHPLKIYKLMINKWQGTSPENKVLNINNVVALANSL